MYHLTTNNKDKITVCASVYCFEPKEEIHGFIDLVYPGHIKPNIAENKLKKMDNWPSCGAYSRTSEEEEEHEEA